MDSMQCFLAKLNELLRLKVRDGDLSEKHSNSAVAWASTSISMATDPLLAIGSELAREDEMAAVRAAVIAQKPEARVLAVSGLHGQNLEQLVGWI